MMSVLVRPASKADIIAYRGSPYHESFRGIVAELDGEIIGIAGVLHGAHLQAFSEISDKLKSYPKSIVIAAREYRKLLNNYDSPIYAEASSKEKTSMKFLKYIGFEHFDKRIYVWQIQ